MGLVLPNYRVCGGSVLHEVDRESMRRENSIRSWAVFLFSVKCTERRNRSWTVFHVGSTVKPTIAHNYQLHPPTAQGQPAIYIHSVRVCVWVCMHTHTHIYTHNYICISHSLVPLVLALLRTRKVGPTWNLDRLVFASWKGALCASVIRLSSFWYSKRRKRSVETRSSTWPKPTIAQVPEQSEFTYSG